MIKIPPPIGYKPGDDPIAQLHAAATYGDIEAMKALIERGVGIDVTDPYDGCTPLMSAAMKSVDAALWLIQNGASVGIINGYTNDTALVFAASNPDPRAVIVCEALLDRGVDLERANSADDTPLTVAAGANHHLAVWLIEHGADWRRTKDDGRTLLHDTVNALALGRVSEAMETVRYLVDKGLDLNALDKQDRTPLDLLPSRPRGIVRRDVIELVEMGAYVGPRAPAGNRLAVRAFGAPGPSWREPTVDRLLDSVAFGHLPWLARAVEADVDPATVMERLKSAIATAMELGRSEAAEKAAAWMAARLAKGVIEQATGLGPLGPVPACIRPLST